MRRYTRYTRPHASQHEYFAHLDAAFAAAEATYDDMAWDALSEREQLDALSLFDRRVHRLCEGTPPQAPNIHRRQVALRREEMLLAAIRDDPAATTAEYARRLGLTNAMVKNARTRLLKAGRLRGERIDFTVWHYEVLL